MLMLSLRVMHALAIDMCNAYKQIQGGCTATLIDLYVHCHLSLAFCSAMYVLTSLPDAPRSF